MYREFQELKAEAESLLEYHVKTGFQYADMDLINARINKYRITERVAAKKIDSYAELEEECNEAQTPNKCDILLYLRE